MVDQSNVRLYELYHRRKNTLTSKENNKKKICVQHNEIKWAQANKTDYKNATNTIHNWEK